MDGRNAFPSSVPSAGETRIPYSVQDAYSDSAESRIGAWHQGVCGGISVGGMGAELVPAKGSRGFDIVYVHWNHSRERMIVNRCKVSSRRKRWLYYFEPNGFTEIDLSYHKVAESNSRFLPVYGVASWREALAAEVRFCIERCKFADLACDYPDWGKTLRIARNG